jgi:hypothetical protein
MGSPSLSNVVTKDSMRLRHHGPAWRRELDAADRRVRWWMAVIAAVQTIACVLGTAGLLRALE